jgi:hypothetical protein
MRLFTDHLTATNRGNAEEAPTTPDARNKKKAFAPNEGPKVMSRTMGGFSTHTPSSNDTRRMKADGSGFQLMVRNLIPPARHQLVKFRRDSASPRTGRGAPTLKHKTGMTVFGPQ